MKTIKSIMGIFILLFCFYLIFISVPFIWKYTGGTFMNGREFIYKGKRVIEFDEDCIVTSSNNLNQVNAICKNKEFVFINGILQKEIDAK